MATDVKVARPEHVIEMTQNQPVRFHFSSEIAPEMLGVLFTASTQTTRSPVPGRAASVGASAAATVTTIAGAGTTTGSSLQRRPSEVALDKADKVFAGVSFERGLDHKQVEERRAEFGFNEIAEKKQNLLLKFLKKFWYGAL